MANPNVSAMSELTLGTLAWTITADQVSVHYGGAYQRMNGGYNDAQMSFKTLGTANSRTGKTTTIPNQFMFGWGTGQDNSDYAVDDSAMTWNEGSTTSMTQIQDSNTNEYLVTKWESSDSTHSFGYYLLNPNNTTGSSGANVHFTPDSGNSMQQNVGVMAGFFGNVDQTNPFSEVHAGYPWWSTASNKKQSSAPMHSIPTQIGDCILIVGESSGMSRINKGHMGIHNLCEVFAYSVSYSNWNSSGIVYQTPKSYSEFVNPQWMTGTYKIGGYDYWSYYENHHNWTILNLQSPRTKTKLFTVPTGKIIKLNKLWVTNPTYTGMFASIDIEGLPSGTGGILDSNDTAVIDLTGSNGTASVGTTPIAKMLRAKAKNNVPALNQPVYLTEGMSLSAKVVCDENYPYLLSETAQIVADFEVVQ